MARGFAASLVRHSKEVQQLQGAQAKEFLRLLNDARDRLLGRLSAGTRLDSAFDAFRLQEILAQSEVSIRALEEKVNGSYRQAAKEAADLSIEHVSTELESLSKAFDAEPLNVSIDAQAVLVDPAQGLLANHFETSVRRYGLDVLNGVRRELFLGLRTGDSFGSIVQNVAGLKGPLGTVGRSSGERLVRTETSQAYGAAQHESIRSVSREVPGLQKTWLHVASQLCSTCGPLHGTQRPLDGTWTIKSGRKTKEVAHAPAHPNCTCRVSAMKPSWRKGLEKLGYLKEQPDGGEEGRAEL